MRLQQQTSGRGLFRVRGRFRVVLVLAVLVQGAWFGHGRWPEAFASAVLACRLCGHTAPVAAGLPELGQGDGNGPVLLRAPVSAALAATPVSWAPSGSAEPGPVPTSAFQASRNASTSSCA
jgi:hypothetical protein